jgi:hypothetical protein
MRSSKILTMHLTLLRSTDETVGTPNTHGDTRILQNIRLYLMEKLCITESRKINSIQVENLSMA